MSERDYESYYRQMLFRIYGFDPPRREEPPRERARRVAQRECERMDSAEDLALAVGILPVWQMPKRGSA
jgi:hypothetical protein